MEKQFVSVSEAARLVNRNRKTLYRDYLKTGKLSADKDPKTGHKRIAISELIRVFGELTPESETKEKEAETVAMPQPETPEKTDETKAEIEALKAELAQMKLKAELLEQNNENLKERLEDKDKNLEDLRAITRLIEHQPEKKKGLFGLFSKSE